MLVVTGPKGDRKAELPLPSISQTVTVEGTTFQVSYGRDATGLLTAIIAPNPSQAQDLHYTVLGKAIDSDKSAVVTLNFSHDLRDVRIDPGFVGSVEVNDHELRHDSARDMPIRRLNPDLEGTDQEPSDSEAPAVAISDTPGATVASTFSPASAASDPKSIASPSATSADAASSIVPLQLPVAANQPSTVTSPGQSDVSNHAPEAMQVLAANQQPFTASATPGPSTVTGAGPSDAPKQHSLFWAEPVTPPSGIAPVVGRDQIKLVELTGSATVRSPKGEEQDAQEGMMIPSGSTISTSSGSSLALFMGGINSVRLLPETEIQVDQQVSTGNRKTVVYLRSGTIFNRVGHYKGERQNYQVVTPQGVALAKGTEFADSLVNAHHYVFVVKGAVDMATNEVVTGKLVPLPNNLASGAMPPANDGNKILFSALIQLQPFQTKLQAIIGHINKGSATPAELAYFDAAKGNFAVTVDDVYDPTHPTPFLGAAVSRTGFGDAPYSEVPRPQDFANPNPFGGLLTPSHDITAGVSQPFVTPPVDPGSDFTSAARG